MGGGQAAATGFSFLTACMGTMIPAGVVVHALMAAPINKERR